MKAKITVVSERERSFMTKAGQRTEKLLTCLDTDPEDMLINTFDFKLETDEDLKRAGTLKGKTLDLGISELNENFGGRIVATGRILTPVEKTTPRPGSA